MVSRSKIIELIKTTIRSFVPDAEIFLFGSRARGNNRPDSDWDVLVLLDAPAVTKAHEEMDYELWNRGLDFGQEINTVIRTRDQWAGNLSLFKRNVLAEGIRL